MTRPYRLGFLTILFLAGCNNSPAPGPGAGGPPPAPEVFFVRPTVKMVIDYEDFPGRAEGTQMVDIRARVTAPLQSIHFTDGAIVKRGEPLFEIDPRTFQAFLSGTKASLEQARAKYERLLGDYQRAIKLKQSNSISQEEFAKVSGDQMEASKAIDKVKSEVDAAELNLSFTKIQSPINGKISRHYLDPGNTVKADDTVLASIVSYDDIYVYFDLDQRTALNLQSLIAKGKMPGLEKKSTPVLMELPNEDHYPRKGYVDFADNKIDADTGTWRLRGLFDNRDHAISSGLFVRVRLPLGEPYQAILVPEQCLSTDQGNKFLFVLDDQDQVISRQVKVGRIHEGLRVILDGVKADDRVIASGLQRVRPGIKVQAKEKK